MVCSPGEQVAPLSKGQPEGGLGPEKQVAFWGTRSLPKAEPEPISAEVKASPPVEEPHEVTGRRGRGRMSPSVSRTLPLSPS